MGTKDFSSFANSRPNIKRTSSNIRTIYKIDFENKEKLLTLCFHGNGFLYKMVRNMVGALLDVGEKKVSLEKLSQILAKKSNTHFLRQASAKGLCLENVFY